MIHKSTANKPVANNRTLVMLSGGIDSTAALWHVLNNPKRYGQIHVHHIHMQNIEARWKAEAVAVKAILEYMRKHTSVEFTASESYINTPHLGREFMFDTEAISFITGYMTSRDSQITKVVIGATGTDFTRGVTDAVKRGRKIHNAFHSENIDHNTMVKEYPMSHLSKLQVHKTLPAELALLTWSCRTPVYLKGIPTECGKCKTCILELKTLKRPADSKGK